jgi:hypothetical protein
MALGQRESRERGQDVIPLDGKISRQNGTGMVTFFDVVLFPNGGRD